VFKVVEKPRWVTGLVWPRKLSVFVVYCKVTDSWLLTVTRQRHSLCRRCDDLALILPLEGEVGHGVRGGEGGGGCCERMFRGLVWSLFRKA
jgi:hypothetical protein